MTTRRLAAEIEYSQPVLYKHFAGMEQIADAVALDGFAELSEVLAAAADAEVAAEAVLVRIAYAYLGFARDNPALYEAMFTRATALHFGADDTPPQLTAAFATLHRAVGRVADGQDVDTLTEVFWACLHGTVTLASPVDCVTTTSPNACNFWPNGSPGRGNRRAMSPGNDAVRHFEVEALH